MSGENFNTDGGTIGALTTGSLVIDFSQLLMEDPTGGSIHRSVARTRDGRPSGRPSLRSGMRSGAVDQLLEVLRVPSSTVTVWLWPLRS